ncbi:MAG: 16S rRNA processing protein RimM [Ruminococcaceae bacterium]|nr:16S rRNA processing protein RimM [Oscillospiraceae bacterium]
MMEKIEVGKINNTHGLRGEMKAISWCDYPEFFEGFSRVWIDHREFELEQVRYQKGGLLLKFKGIDAIEQAEGLKQKMIWAEKREVTDQLEEGRYLISDLIGLPVYEDGRVLGKLKDVLQTGANDVYIVATTSGKELLLPVIDEVVERIDLEQGIYVHLMEGMEEQ